MRHQPWKMCAGSRKLHQSKGQLLTEIPLLLRSCHVGSRSMTQEPSSVSLEAPAPLLSCPAVSKEGWNKTTDGTEHSTSCGGRGVVGGGVAPVTWTQWHGPCKVGPHGIRAGQFGLCHKHVTLGLSTLFRKNLNKQPLPLMLAFKGIFTNIRLLVPRQTQHQQDHVLVRAKWPRALISMSSLPAQTE